jgi:hypothetical protein
MASPGRFIDGALLPRWSSRLRPAVARAYRGDGAQIVGIRGYVEPAIGIGLKKIPQQSARWPRGIRCRPGPVGRRTWQPAGPPNGATRVYSRREVLVVGPPAAAEVTDEGLCGYIIYNIYSYRCRPPILPTPMLVRFWSNRPEWVCFGIWACRSPPLIAHASEPP